ncbi:MAG: hypothetical protein ACFFCS_16450 [Candidatus Hodarchaeota archaeon]
MVETIVFDPINRTLLGVVMTLLIINSWSYITKAKLREKTNERRILIGYAFMFLGFLVNQIFYFISNLAIPGKYIGHVFLVDYGSRTPLYELSRKLGNLANSFGTSLYLLMFEYVARRTKFIISILNFLSVIAIFFLPFDLSIFLATIILTPIQLLQVVVTIILFIKWSRLEFKVIASLQLLGLLFFVSAGIFASNEVRSLQTVPLFLPPLFTVTGCLIFLIQNTINPKNYSQTLKYFIGVGILSAILLGFLITLVTIALEFGYVIIFISISLFASYAYLKIFMMIRKQKPSILTPSPTTNEMKVDVLEAFAKRKLVTEEEVLFHKERKICIVCKSHVERRSYICPGCDGLYCLNCSEALSNLDNSCWSCNTAFDPTKPVLSTKEEDDTTTVDKGSELKRFNK